ncbi:MAG: S1C family serine protease [Phycisphaerae bacterium]
MRSLTTLFIFVGLALFGDCTPSYGADAATVYRNASPSVVQIYCLDANAKPVWTGSGVFISEEGDIVTNDHVVEGAVSFVVELHDGHLLPVSGVALRDKTSDLAIIRAKVLTKSPPLVANGKRPDTGTRVFAIGSPEGLLNTISDGLVSGKDTYNGHEVLRISVPISPGSSGGALLNETGELIGITEAGMKEGQNLNLAVPADYVLAAIKRAAIKADKGAIERPSDGSPENNPTARAIENRKNARTILDMRTKELLAAANKQMLEGDADKAIGLATEILRLHWSYNSDAPALEADNTSEDDAIQILNASFKKKGIIGLNGPARAKVDSPVDFAGFVVSVFIDRKHSTWCLNIAEEAGKSRTIILSGEALDTLSLTPHSIEGKVVEIKGKRLDERSKECIGLRRIFKHGVYAQDETDDRVISVDDDKSLRILAD